MQHDLKSEKAQSQGFLLFRFTVLNLFIIKCVYFSIKRKTNINFKLLFKNLIIDFCSIENKFIKKFMKIFA